MSEIAPVEYFKQNHYVVIKNFIPEAALGLYYEYCIMQAQAIDYKIAKYPKFWHCQWDGRFNDPMCPGVFAKYGDMLMETTMKLLTGKAEEYTGLKLNPNYTFWRLYEKDSELKKHTDRPSCEISATINLGSNTSNVDKEVYPDYEWPIFLKTKEGKELPVKLNPGDALIYKGYELEHWREKFIGLNNAQVFFHWCEKDGKLNNIYDGRPLLGVAKDLFEQSEE